MSKWSELIERQAYWRYCTLFWPKYWACAAPGMTVATTRARATQAPRLQIFMLEILSCLTARVNEAGVCRCRRPGRSSAKRPPPRPNASPPAAIGPSRSVLPSRLQVHVELGRRGGGARGRRQRPSLGELARDVEEPAEPILGLDVALEGVGGGGGAGRPGRSGLVDSQALADPHVDVGCQRNVGADHVVSHSLEEPTRFPLQRPVVQVALEHVGKLVGELA